MSLKVDIYDALENILSTGVSVYQITRPTTSYNLPCIVFNQISTGPNNTKSGASITDETRFQFDIYDRSSTGVESVAETLRNGFDYYEGVNIQKVFFQDQQDADFDMNAGTLGEFRIIQDYIIRYNR